MRRMLVAALGAVVLAGCERAMHDMYAQPRYEPGAASPLFDDGRADRPPPPGSVPADFQERAAGEPAGPPRYTRALLVRGQERYGIYCLPCHSALGDGDGPVVRRGFPRPPSYHEQRLRDAPDSHFYDVITRGHGIMYSYADRVTPQDRWAIVAYIRALQLSQHADVAQLPPALREQLPRPQGHR